MLGKSGARAMTQAAMEVYRSEPPESPWRGLACYLAGIGHHLTAEPESAEQLLDEGADVAAPDAPCVAALCLAGLVMVAIQRGDWTAALDAVDRAQDLRAREEVQGAPLSALVIAAAAAVHAHDGRLDDAKRELKRGRELLGALGDFVPWYGAEARILLAYASVWLADAVGARTLLAEASRLARKTRDAVVFEQWFDDAWAYLDTLAESNMAGASSLTIAELRVLRFLPSHRSFREIAVQLGVSANTVKTQALAVYRKLGVASRSDAVARAAQAGLLGH
jgi:LuxR family maltose regulon positive regulatory protein